MIGALCVCDGPFLDHAVAQIAAQTLKPQLLLTPKQASMGEARNMLLRMARAAHLDYCVQWDADDAYASERVAQQYTALLAADAFACVLCRETLECSCGYRTISSRRDYWEHSIFMRTPPDGLTYPHKDIGEDSSFLWWLVRSGLKITALDAPELYTYRCHGANISGIRHFDTLFRLAGSDHQPTRCHAERIL